MTPVPEPASHPISLAELIRVFGLTVLLSSGILLGCEEDVTAVVGTERAFTLFGVLSPDLDSQAVLVYPIEGRLQPYGPEPLDVTFTSTDLTTGETRVWNDSATVDARGAYTHVFWSHFRAPYGHHYRVSVTRPSDGLTSFAEVEIPPRLLVEPAEPNLGAFVVLPVYLRGEAPRLIRTEIEYIVRITLPGGVPQPDQYVTRPYVDEARKIDGGWRLDVDLSSDYRFVRQTLEERQDRRLVAGEGIRFLGMTLRLIAADAQWNPPNGVFDPEQLVQPGLLSNVQNGFGLVGAGYRLEAALHPSAAALDEAGFVLPE